MTASTSVGGGNVDDMMTASTSVGGGNDGGGMTASASVGGGNGDGGMTAGAGGDGDPASTNHDQIMPTTVSETPDATGILFHGAQNAACFMNFILLALFTIVISLFFKVGPDECTTQATHAKVYFLVIIPILPRDIADNSNLF